MGRKGASRVIWFLIAFVIALMVLAVIVLLAQKTQSQGESAFTDVLGRIRGEG